MGYTRPVEFRDGDLATPLNAENLHRMQDGVFGQIVDPPSQKLKPELLPDSVVTGDAAFLVGNPDLLISGAITRNADGAATAAPVVWPDGATGTYTATTVSTAFPGAVDAYTVTHVKAGTTKTYTQPAVARNAAGAVTNRPAITVA